MRDAGWAGPSIWFAKHKNVTIDAITISPTQLRLAQEAVAQAGLTDRIKVQLGDFHKLEEQFPVNTFDGVFFLSRSATRKAIAASWPARRRC